VLTSNNGGVTGITLKMVTLNMEGSSANRWGQLQQVRCDACVFVSEEELTRVEVFLRSRE
jgi:hypothetical protein